MISEKVQVLVELLKQGDGAKAAATELRTVEAQVGKTSAAANNLRNALAGMFAGVSAAFVVNEVVQATLSLERMNNTLRAVTGSSAAAGREMNFVRGQADRMGLDLESATRSFASLSAAAKGTSLAGEGARQIFVGIAEAGTVLGLSAAQMEGALQAVQQMISKGTVSAEELRGQLGERLPGAFNIAARAMGVTTQELGKMLEQGQVIASDFLPKFAAELTQTFGSEVEKAAQSLNAGINRMRTALFDLKASVGTELRGAMLQFVSSARDMASAMRENLDVVKSLALPVGLLAAEMMALSSASRIAAASQALFGAAWIKSAADVRAATALIATSTVSMATTVNAALATVTVGIWGAVELFRLFKAEAQASRSRDLLLAQTEERRKSMEQLIDLHHSLGQIDDKQAADAKKRLRDAFTATITTKFQPFATGPTSVQPAPFTTSEPDISARERALSDVAVKLVPGIRTSTTKAQATVKPKGPTEDEIKTLEQLRALQERMFIESLSGLEKENARIEAQFAARERQIEQLSQKREMDTEELARLHEMNAQVREMDFAELALREKQKAEAEERRKKQEMARQASEEMQRLEQTLTTQAINSSETRIQQAEREFAARIALIDQLFAAGKIDAERWNALSVEASGRRAQTLAPAVNEGRLEAERLAALRDGESAENFEINKTFEARRSALEAYYEFESQAARANSAEVQALEAQKAESLKMLAQQQRIATSEIAQGMIQVGQAAQTQFASGLARSFMMIADGSKSAKEAFKDFALNFLKMLGEMIMQTLIFIAIKAALRGFGFASEGTQVMAGESHGSVAHLAAVGGIFDRHLRQPTIMAAGGMALRAAAGVPGVSEVDQATYFPKFNVIAGEAGREVLTVMAKPELIEVNGHKVIVGSVQSKRVAMMSAEDLQGMWRNNLTQPMALGGMASSMFAGMGTAAPVNGAQVSQRTVNGAAEIVVKLGPELRAEIVRSAIEGAVLKVAQELQVDSAISAGVRRLAA